MSDAMPEMEIRPLRSLEGAGRGVFGTVIDVGADTLEHAVQSAFELVETVRRETFHVTFASVELVETAQLTVMKVTRDALGRVDRMTSQVTQGLQTTALALTRTARFTGELAGDLAAGTAKSLTASGGVVKTA